MQGSVPNCGLNWTKTEERRGRMCEVPKLKGGSVAQKLRRQSFQMSGPKLWNALPRNLRNINTCSLDQFKEVLDCFLSKVPDEPKTENLTPGATDVMTGKATNSLEFQCGRRTEAWDPSDFDFGQGQNLPKS